MTHKEKRLLTIVLVIAAVYLGAVGAVVLAVQRAGMLVVEVEEKGPGGDSVRIRVPAVFAQVALRFVPEKVFTDQAQDVGRWLPVIQAACAELGRSPDGVLLEVHSPDEDVSVVKKGRRLQVDVRSPQERVHVVMPLSMVACVLSRFEKAIEGS
jgi:hypothetical protein